MAEIRTVRKPRRVLTTLEVLDIDRELRRRAATLSVKELAAKHGVSATVVRRRYYELRDAGCLREGR